MALQSTPPSEVEDAAWILTQMAHLELSRERSPTPRRPCSRLSALFPGYHYALGNLAKVRIQQKRYDEAVQLLQQRYQAARHAENLYDLAEALQLAGRKEEAKKSFRRVRAEVAVRNQSRRQLESRTDFLLRRLRS